MIIIRILILLFLAFSTLILYAALVNESDIDDEEQKRIINQAERFWKK